MSLFQLTMESSTNPPNAHYDYDHIQTERKKLMHPNSLLFLDYQAGFHTGFLLGGNQSLVTQCVEYAAPMEVWEVRMGACSPREI